MLVVITRGGEILNNLANKIAIAGFSEYLYANNITTAVDININICGHLNGRNAAVIIGHVNVSAVSEPIVFNKHSYSSLAIHLLPSNCITGGSLSSSATCRQSSGEQALMIPAAFLMSTEAPRSL